MKDNFSRVARAYSIYRPTYPTEVFDFIYSHLSGHKIAWDCGTGNGQVATRLAEKFGEVIATDISEKQMSHALKKENISYQVVSAEDANFPPDHFDLITVAQAIHWFDFERFYGKVNKSLKLNGLIAILGYGLIEVNAECDKIIHYLYKDLLDDFWDPERQYIENHYQDIPFPFREISTPAFKYSVKWSADDVINYLKTWSAVQHYINENGQDPVDLVKKDLQKAWHEDLTVTFPILFRLGKKL